MKSFKRLSMKEKSQKQEWTGTEVAQEDCERELVRFKVRSQKW